VKKKVTPETSLTVYTWPCPAYIHDEKVAPETSATFSTWPVPAIYVMKKFTPYAIICDETIYSRDFPYCLHMAFPAYIRDKIFSQETSTTVSIWPVEPIYLMKNILPRIPLYPHGLISLNTR
jgi:hypothetical protein